MPERKVIDSLNKEVVNRHIDDGMDMSLIVVNYETKTFHFSGARNPLYYFLKCVLNTQRGHIHSVGHFQLMGNELYFLL